MNRRTLIKLIAAFPFVSEAFLLNKNAASASEEKHLLPARWRARPGDAKWPKADQWQQLNLEVNGHLLQPKSLEEMFEKATASRREALLKNLENPYFRGDEPGLTQSAGWVDAWEAACSPYVVAAQNEKHVVAAVNFARENNLRLVVKGGGHSYKGTSNAPDSLLIWTRALKEITLHEAFVPDSCPGMRSYKAVTIGAGAMWMDVYNAVTTKGGRYVQGGGCATVGVVGLVHGGGFGSFSKHYGTAAASLLQAEIVTADGAHRVINEQRNPDLFWAIKGGGGGSYGVITKLTLKTHDLPEHFGGVSIQIKASSDEAYQRLIEHFIEFYSTKLFNHHWGESAKLNPENTLSCGMVSCGLSEAESQMIWKPFLDWVRGSPQDYTLNKAFIGAMSSRHWWDADWRGKNLARTIIKDPRPDAPPEHVYWTDNQGEVGVFLHGYESLWLPSSLLKRRNQKRLARALFASSRHWSVELHFNKGLAGAPAEALEAVRHTATNPAVLDAFVLVIIAGGEQSIPGLPGHEPNLSEARANAQRISNAMSELRPLVNHSGCYVSESSFFEKSWQQAFWGSNYDRLKSIKERYDCHDLFIVHHGVGSERWARNGFQRIT